MRFDWSIVGVLARTELRMVLRDPRVLVTGLLLPAIAMPLLIFGSSFGMQKREKQLREVVCEYAVVGSNAAWAKGLIEARLQTLGTNKNAVSHFREVNVTNGLAALNDKTINVLVTALTPGEAATNIDRSKKQPKLPGGEPAVTGTPVLRLTWRADREESTAAMDRFREFLENLREGRRESMLQMEGLQPPEKAVVIEDHNVASERKVVGSNVGRVLTLMLLVFILSGGAIVALDTLAGEKERGSLETLLVSGAGRREIVLSKFISVSAVGLSVAIAQILSAFVFTSLKIIKLPIDFTAVFSPLTLFGVVVVYLPLVGFISGILLLLSARARSYKEAQLVFIPVMFLCLAPALAPIFPGLSLRSVMAFVPIASTALSIKDVLSGNVDWLFLGVAWCSTAAAAFWTARLTLTSVSEERFVTPSAEDAVQTAGPQLFSKQVLVWFAVIWALLLVVSNYLQKADIRTQLFLNLIVFLFGGSVLMIWRYKLPLKETLSLRNPPSAAWLAVLLGVPGGMLSATGLFRLVSYVLPIPQELVEAFSEEIIPKNISFGMLMLFLAIMPGIFEEIAFRGVLLSGLRRRMKPAMAVLIVGAVFGLFHVALFRFAPTFILGVCLATVVILTRSIFPAMLWHALNNGLGIWSAKQQILLGELEWQYYVIGGISLAAAFWILWRNRVEQGGSTRSSQGVPERS